jgi:hypothetical protein
MTPFEATIAAVGACFSLSVGVMGWLISRAVHAVDANVTRTAAKLDELASRDSAQDLSISDCKTRLATIEEEVLKLRERIHRLVELSAPAWLKMRADDKDKAP